MKEQAIYHKYGFRNSASYFLYIFIVAILYPIIVFSLPEFKDYQNYISHVERSLVILSNHFVLISSGSLSILFAEPLWYILLAVLNIIFDSNIVLGLILASSMTILSLGLSRHNKRPWTNLLLIFVLFPLANKYFMQLRQGFAIAIYIWAYTIKGNKSLILRLLTPFIHTSMFLLLGVETAYNFFRYLNLSKRLLITFSAIVALITTVAIPLLVNLADAQGFVSDAFILDAPQVSGMGAILWSFYGLVFFLLSRPSKEVAIGITGILVFVFSQFYIDIGSRFIPIFLPFIIASYTYSSLKSQILIFASVLFGLLLWGPIIMNPSSVFT